MQSANTIMIPKYKLTCLLLAALPLFCFAQENSPYSRYGIGNLVPTSNIANRAMGGISAGVTDFTTVNTVNPASYSNLIYTTLDVGLAYDGRNLKSKINYKLQSSGRNSIDSTETLYEGNGGVNEAFIGTGLKIKNFSIGINTGYLFGEKDYNSRLIFNNDTVAYYKANYATKTRFGGVFLTAGVQYAAKIKGGTLRFGAYGNLKRQYSATKDDLVETFNYDANGAPVSIDSIHADNGQKGKVQMPATFGACLLYT